MTDVEGPEASPLDTEPAPELEEFPRSRVKRVFSGSRGLIRLLYRDPEHVAERLTLYAVDRLADESRRWAETARARHPDAHRVTLAEELRTRSAKIARVDGAISGTPFFVALVPGYLTYLWQELRMTLRTAALYDRDPGTLRTAAEMLALRGVHPDVDTAEAALSTVRDSGDPEPPKQRRSLHTWFRSIYLVLVFGGFLSPSDTERKTGWRYRIAAAFGLAVGAGLWVMTWVLPLTFMIMMAWGCETHARQLGRRTLFFYEEDESVATAILDADRHTDKGHDKRAVLRSIALFLSVAIPIGFVAYANHVRQSVGINWVGALGALVALSLVFATLVFSSRS